MKKTMALVLALTLAFALCLPAFADVTEQTANGEGSTNLTYSVAQTFTVTIPEAVTIDAGTKTGSLTVSVAPTALIPYRNEIRVELTACAFEMENGDDRVAYTITDDTTATVSEEATVLTHEAGSPTATTEVLSLAVTGTPKYSGDYTDTITFTVTVEYTNPG